MRTSDYRSRSITAILYLNPVEWGDSPQAGAIEDGGQLRIFHRGPNEDGKRTVAAKALTHFGDASTTPIPPSLSEQRQKVASGAKESDRSYTDVIPKGGTLVIFDSRRIWHQVLPSTQQRLALTCWVSGSSGSEAEDGGS